MFDAAGVNEPMISCSTIISFIDIENYSLHGCKDCIILHSYKTPKFRDIGPDFLLREVWAHGEYLDGDDSEQLPTVVATVCNKVTGVKSRHVIM